MPSASTVLLGSRSSVTRPSRPTRPPPDTKPGQGRQRRKPQVSRGEATGPGSGRLQARGAAQDAGPPGTVPVCRRAGGTGHRRWASPHTVPCWLRPASQAAVTGASVGPAPRVWPLCRHCVPRWRPPVQTAGRPSCTLRLENTNKKIWRRVNTLSWPRPPGHPEEVSRNGTKCHPHHLWLVSCGVGQGHPARTHRREPWPRAPGLASAP